MDYTITKNRKDLCRRDRTARRLYRLYRLCSLRAERLTGMQDGPAIWNSLRPARACHVAARAAWRYSQLSLRFYDRFLSHEVAERERLRKASPEYRDERRARLIARLCGSLTATIADARARGYCDPGIAEFQRRHGIGDTATLPELVRTGNSLAVSLALKLARQAKQA